MATVDELSQPIMGDADKEILVDASLFRFKKSPDLLKAFSSAISSISFSSLAAERFATYMLEEQAKWGARWDAVTRATTLEIARANMNLSSVKESIAASINPLHAQALLTSAKIADSNNSLRFMREMIDKENARLSSVIDSFIKSSQFGVSSFSFLYDSRLPALLKTLNPYHEIEQTLAGFYEYQLDLFNGAFGPTRRRVAELTCDVESVKVDIAEGNKRVIHAEYDRGKVIELLSSIIAVRELQPDLSIELEDGYLDSESLFDCLNDHDTHYGEYTGEVKIKIRGKDSPNRLQSIIKELIDAGHIDEDRSDDFDYLARRAELFFRRNFPKIFYHGLHVLAEASVIYALDDPLPADEYRALEKKLGDAIRRELPRPTLGGNTRGGDAWKKVPPNQFAKRVDELYDLADCLLKGYNKHRPSTNWLKKVKLSDEFINLPKACSEQVIDSVAALLPDRLKESRSKSHKHGSTPLAFACELAAQELSIVMKNGKRYSSESLLKKYRAGGGVRGKQRIQSKTNQKTSQQIQKNAIQ